MINRITLIGNVGSNPSVYQGGDFATFSVATTSNWKDKGGEWQNKTEWHRINANGFVASYIEKHIRKGQQVYVAGSMSYGEYTDRDGNKIKTADVKAVKVKILGRKEDSYSGDHGSSDDGYGRHNTGEDVPF